MDTADLLPGITCDVPGDDLYYYCSTDFIEAILCADADLEGLPTAPSSLSTQLQTLPNPMGTKGLLAPSSDVLSTVPEFLPPFPPRDAMMELSSVSTDSTGCDTMSDTASPKLSGAEAPGDGDGPSAESNTMTGPAAAAQPQKICTECETSTTPQWRRGPDGRASLCNACGLRFMKRCKVQTSTAGPGSCAFSINFSRISVLPDSAILKLALADRRRAVPSSAMFGGNGSRNRNSNGKPNDSGNGSDGNGHGDRGGRGGGGNGGSGATHALISV